MRLELLKCLSAKNLGLSHDEYQAKREAKYSYHSTKFKDVRNVAYINNTMDIRIKDAYQHLRETALKVSQMRKRLKRVTRNDPELGERILNQLEREMKFLKEQIQMKNQKSLILLPS